MRPFSQDGDVDVATRDVLTGVYHRAADVAGVLTTTGRNHDGRARSSVDERVPA